MTKETLKEILRQVAAGTLAPEEAEDQLCHLPFQDLGFACVDHHRGLRKGFPEVVFGQGKTAEQVIGIMEAMAGQKDTVLVTRLSPEKAAAVAEAFPDAAYDPLARMLVLQREAPRPAGRGVIGVICAGTSDMPVAREAAITARAMGNDVREVNDVGVSGIHRLFAHSELIRTAKVLVVAAGMEGALPSVVAGMCGCPVVAVPTSVGYGTSLGGLTALLAMLNSCASNVCVVNIDNGFGAGYVAAMINRGDA
ncbi:MAG: nickel pincer cofactor biosynthesis protein LarB [Deltaproteobacteria bacterium]|nr:nickel pincer cofactor biosynthesis protein LarB [Deltaproteobacteria bacterium]